MAIQELQYLHHFETYLNKISLALVTVSLFTRNLNLFDIDRKHDALLTYFKIKTSTIFSVQKFPQCTTIAKQV